MATDLYRLCETIEKKHAAGHTILDDEMIGDVQDLTNLTKEIKAALDKPNLEQVRLMKRNLEAEILRLITSLQLQTGLAINGVWLEHHTVIGVPVPSVTAVKLDIRL